jgi:uncharacterized membrane protein YebE (DUF533 family)
MSIQNLLNQFLGGQNASHTSDAGLGANLKDIAGSASEKFGGIGLGGGAAIGGIAALLIGSKKVRGFAGSAAKVGGAALVGGLAFKAFNNWQQSQSGSQATPNHTDGMATKPLPQSVDAFESEVGTSIQFQLTLVKAMIAAAKADGHIDDVEQNRIFNAVDDMTSSAELKNMMMDLLRSPATIEELVLATNNVEQKSEVYLVSCFAIDEDNEAERLYLQRLASALSLPQGLALEIQQQANHAVLEAA